MLHRIQEDLERLYDISYTLNVHDYVCDEDTARAAVGDAVLRGEVVWVREMGQEIALGLYISQDAIQALVENVSTANWRTENFWAWSLATEGVSHLVYLHYKATLSESVSLLELELQAEVDKYVIGMMQSSENISLVLHSAQLRRQLFEDSEYLDSPDSEEGQRYRQATRLAASYAAFLEQTFLAHRAVHAFSAHLRRFYRLGGSAKFQQCMPRTR
ncbi:MAG: hypothetical protein H6715_03855 [Myxococcales bacterium]|nr:hypothetical protein [Myxococcales bacterium]MCB9708663.1 hypothetical protein [Myxococcales bacterium]